ncbi:MAG: hypothetical protein ACO4AU_08910 [bacterium]|jgi:hypothetical protein
MDKVFSMKLVTGDELLARLAGEDEEWFDLDQPMTIAMTHQGMAIVPLLAMAKEQPRIRVRKGNVVAYAEAHPEFGNKYLESVTGIATVPAGGIELASR